MNLAKNEPVLVIGATGFLGMEICRQLVDKKRKVKGLVRAGSDAAKVQALQQMGVETVTGDLKEPDSLNNPVKNVSAIISTASSTLSRQEGDSIETVDGKGQLNLVEAAQKAGVKQFIFISFNANPLESPLQTAKRAVEKKLMDGNMNYTILQPTFFMEIWLSPAIGFDFINSKATIYGEGKNKLFWISLKDVAAFAVACLDNEGAKNKVFELGAAEALSPLEVVKIFEQRTNSSFTLEHVPAEALYAQKEAATDSLSQSFAALMIGYAEGNKIDAKESLKIFPQGFVSVSDYTKQFAAS